MNSIRAVFLLAAVLTGCATYQDKVSESRALISSGQIEQALSEFEKLASIEDGDQLVHLLDYGVALQIAGRLPESNKVLLKADQLAEQIDYHSISRIAGSALTSEEMIQYKGDTFERIFINAMLALNYLEMGQLDEALVECRRINEKYQKLRIEEKKEFELNPFAKYLAGLAWEASHRYDDAYLSFAEAYKLSPDISTIREDLIRTAKKAKRMTQYKEWKAAFPEVKEEPEWFNKKLGELVVIYQQGWGPRKAPNPQSPRFPILRSVYNETQGLQVEVGEQGSFKTKIVYDVNSAAIKTLLEDQGALAARRFGGFIAKEVVADQIRQKDELLGTAAWLFMHLSDRADLRQWSLLPSTIQVARIPLKAGKYKFNLQGLDAWGHPSSEKSEEQEVEIKPGRTQFVVWRSIK